MFNPNGETGWEDKKILYQDSPPSKPERKYTKRVLKGDFFCYLHKQFITQNFVNNQFQILILFYRPNAY